MSDVKRLRVHPAKLIAWLCTRWGRSLEVSAGQDQQPHLPQLSPQQEGQLFASCSDQLKVFPLLLGETSGSVETNSWVWGEDCFCSFCSKAVWVLTPPCLFLGSLRQCNGLQAFTLHPHFCSEVGGDLHGGWSAQGALQRGAGWGCHGPVPLPPSRCGQNIFHWQCANWHEGKGTLRQGVCS